MPATPDRLHRPRTVLGFDYGRRRMGVAVGEELTGAARPLVILHARRQHPDWEAIGRLIGEWRPDLAVVGVPRHADGSANPVTEAALRFARQLRDRYGLPVETIDERLSSFEAETRIAEATRDRSRQNGRVDAMAAAVILESWLHQQKQ